MVDKNWSLLLLLVLKWTEEEKAEKWAFLLEDSKHVVKTDAGEMRLVRGYASKFAKSPIHIGFIRMEPKSKAKIGHINKGELVERKLKKVLKNFLTLVLHVTCKYWQSFFIAGGTYPASVLSGFDHATLSAAFNVSEAELGKMFTRQNHGPIIYLSSSRHPSVWSKFLEMNQHDKLAHMKRYFRVIVRTDSFINVWSDPWIPNFASGIPGKTDVGFNTVKWPDFKNDYGWSMAILFFGLTTSAHDNKPQFLVGKNSLLRAMRDPELEAALDMSKDGLKKIINAQRESVILSAFKSIDKELV
ncbi:vicilin-like antimicrobial peptides 2-3, partial [Striga asiatica]